MRIIQTIETLWEVDERAFTRHAYLDYEDWIENGGGTLEDFLGFVKYTVAKYGTELYDLKMIESDTTFTFESAPISNKGEKRQWFG